MSALAIHRFVDLWQKLRRAAREGRLIVSVIGGLRRLVFGGSRFAANTLASSRGPHAPEDLSPRAHAIHHALMQARQDSANHHRKG